MPSLSLSSHSILFNPCSLNSLPPWLYTICLVVKCTKLFLLEHLMKLHHILKHLFIRQECFIPTFCNSFSENLEALISNWILGMFSHFSIAFFLHFLSPFFVFCSLSFSLSPSPLHFDPCARHFFINFLNRYPNSYHLLFIDSQSILHMTLVLQK